MRMELIQPFIQRRGRGFRGVAASADENCGLGNGPGGVSPQGRGGTDRHQGDIEGRVILDLSPEVAMKVATILAGTEVEASDQVVRETVCEMANMVIGKFSHAAERPRLFTSKCFRRKFI